MLIWTRWKTTWKKKGNKKKAEGNDPRTRRKKTMSLNLVNSLKLKRKMGQCYLFFDREKEYPRDPTYDPIKKRASESKLGYCDSK